MILGIDAGNYETKVCDGKLFKFPSALGEYRELNLINKLEQFDFNYEYKGIKGFGGTLAQQESQLAYSKLGDTKAHEQALIRVLLSCSLYNDELNLVVGQPISKHKDEKQQIKDMLIGTHEIKINGIDRKIKINDVEVAVETASAYILKPKENVTIIDMGAGTINVATIRGFKYIDKDSFTICEGAESLRSLDFNAICRVVIERAKLNSKSNIYLIGGKSQELFKVFNQESSNVEILQPSNYANAIAFYRLGVRKKWGTAI